MKRHITLGFSDMELSDKPNAIFYRSNGKITINGSLKDECEKFCAGDTVGCGVNLETKESFFTKNGLRIDSVDSLSIFAVYNADKFFPTVALFSPGDEVEANFGPKFLFNLSPLTVEELEKIMAEGTKELEKRAKEKKEELEKKAKEEKEEMEKKAKEKKEEMEKKAKEKKEEMEKKAKEELEISAKEKKEQLEKKIAKKCQQNYWDADSTCDFILTISGPNNSTVCCCHWKEFFWNIVYANYSISSSASFRFDIFYFEMRVKKMKCNIYFGLDVKANRNPELLAYCNNGDICINWSCKKVIDEFGTGDTVGLGVNLVTKRLFFTKNGRRIDSANDLFIPAHHNVDELFPNLTLFSPGDKIETNFGPKFLFDLSSLPEEGKLGKKVAKQVPRNFASHAGLTNCWDASFCTDDLIISGPNISLVHHKRDKNAIVLIPAIVLAKFSVSECGAAFSSTVFYFEINVKQMGKYVIGLGFAAKQNNDDYNRILTYWSNADIEEINGSKKTAERLFDTGDSVGCGVNMATRQFFGTKNRTQIYVYDDLRPLDSSISADALFPFAVLANFGDKIEANFGPEFVFDISSLF